MFMEGRDCASSNADYLRLSLTVGRMGEEKGLEIDTRNERAAFNE